MPGTATTILIDGTPTNGADPWIDSLVWGGAWTDADGGTVTISYAAASGQFEGAGTLGWSADALAALDQALALWESVANIDFVKVAAPQADALFWVGTEVQADYALGWSEIPGYNDTEVLNTVFNGQDSSWSAGALARGGLGFITLVHEIGHLLGLAHPHDGGSAPDATNFPWVEEPFGDYGMNNQNQGIYTTMSYNDGWISEAMFPPSDVYGLQAGPMHLDIAAIQAIYGANTTYAAGDNTYYLPTSNGPGTFFSSIWDTGGIDTISNAGSSLNATICLEAARMSQEPLISQDSTISTVIRGGYTIAYGVVIENAIGGSGSDWLTGNEYANVLDGGAGVDYLYGGLGDDTYIVDDEADEVSEQDAMGGTDTVRSSVSFTISDYNYIEILVLTGTTAIFATGNGRANTLIGNAADNWLEGGAGDDTMAGGLGDDTYIVDSSSDIVIEAANGGFDSVSSFVTFALAANVEELVLLGSTNIIGIGNEAANRLIGSAGSNVLYGLGGDDTLSGGPAFGGTNQLWGGTGSDTASYVDTSGAVYADLGAQAGYVDGVLVDQMNSIENLTGSWGRDVLVGDAGSNVLAGGDNSDILYGQGGDDTLIGGNPNYDPNQLWGGTGTDTASYAWTSGAVYADLAAQAGYVDGYLYDQMNSIENLIGGSGNDVLVGDAGGNVLTGGAGADVLYGQGGDDILIGGSVTAGSTNQLWGGTGIDTASYVGTTGAVYADLSSLSAYVDGVLVDQMSSIENLIGGSGSNVLVGDAAGNVLKGGTNTDYLYGQDGNDTLIGGGAASGGANQLWGGTGNDTASYVGTSGAVYADLGAQSGRVDGVLVDLMNSIENLTGGSVADTLVGNSGANRLAGGAGGDALWGKGGADVFVYNDYADSNLVTGYDIIGDFVSGTSKLDLTALGLDASHIVILSDAQSTSLYIEKTAGVFDVSTDLAISLVGANVITMGDILL